MMMTNHDVEAAIPRPVPIDSSRRRYTVGATDEHTAAAAGVGVGASLWMGLTGAVSAGASTNCSSYNNHLSSMPSSTAIGNVSGEDQGATHSTVVATAWRSAEEQAPKSRGVLLPISQANNNTTNTNHTTGVVLTNTAAGTGNNNNNNSSNSKHTEPPPRVLHPILLKVPLQIRFVTIGIILNIAFLGVYNVAITTFRSVAAPTTYSIVYLLFIPLGHWMNIMFVFGWPERYCSSLLSNLPVGLTGIGLGSGLTAYLDHVQFNDRIEEYIRDHFTFTRMPPRIPEDKSEFYSSLVVLFCTSLWTYFLSVYINTPRKQSDKKLL